ncbi:MAG: hypothetical protein M3179_08070 [Actinomycetota bacterium]|nr:hypothetical protein [Actinomycetota bacterium]
MAEPRRVGWVQKLPSWIDWLAAVVLAVVVFNANVTSTGDPLSGVRGATEAASRPGISDAARTSFYAAIMVGGAALAAGALVMVALGRRLVAPALLAFRAFGLLAAAGTAGLLLDYTDGPIRTVQLFAYVALILATLRFARLAAGLSASRPDSSH